MLVTITLIISALVVVNFVLLKLSVNKTEATPKEDKTIVVLNSNIAISSNNTQNLGATGS